MVKREGREFNIETNIKKIIGRDDKVIDEEFYHYNQPVRMRQHSYRGIGGFM